MGTSPGKLRLLFVSERAGLNTPPLSSEDLSDLRIYTKARVIYALTAAKVAGAVTQTNMYDYRRGLTPSNKHSHFGVPLSCLEIKLKDNGPHKTTDEQNAGQVVVTGASVAGGETALGVNGTLCDALARYSTNKMQERSGTTTRWLIFESVFEQALDRAVNSNDTTLRVLVHPSRRSVIRLGDSIDMKAANYVSNEDIRALTWVLVATTHLA